MCIFIHCCKWETFLFCSLRLYLWETATRKGWLFSYRVSTCLQGLIVTGRGMDGCAGVMLLLELCQYSVVLTTFRISIHQVGVLGFYISIFLNKMRFWVLYAPLKTLMLQNFSDSKPILCIFPLSHRKWQVTYFFLWNTSLRDSVD